MEKTEVTKLDRVTIAGINFILVIKSSLKCQPVGDGISFSGSKQPVSIVVSTPSANKAFDINGEIIKLDRLIQENPGLAEALKIA